MKASPLPILLLVAFLGTFLQSCVDDSCEREVTYNKAIPVYKTAEEIRTPIQTEAPRELVNPGKIYLHNDLILLNELREGIHVYDNTDPSNPQNLGFIPIPGNLDIAVKRNVLYADNYIDLVAIDISNVQNAQLLKREVEVFPHDGKNDDGFLVYYDMEEVTEVVDCNSNRGNEILFTNGFTQAETSVGTFAGSAALGSSPSRPNTGVAGSTSRFALYDKYLYTIDNRNLRLFDVDDVANPTFHQAIQVDAGWNMIETIFPHEDKLFLGSRNGMYIYENANPSNPELISILDHATACDPVFVYGDYAYVTLHDGSTCNGWTNQLDLVDISDIYNPTLTSTFQMESPRGLTISNDILFLCEGEFGMKVFDVSNPTNLDNNQLAHFTHFSSFDVISIGSNQVVLVIGADGLYQFDASEPSAIKQLSYIPVK